MMTATSIQPTSDLLGQLSSEMANAVERAGAATVRVNARMRLPATGVIWAFSGVGTIIVTSNHVVERDEDITITTADGRELTASLTGRDPTNDLALLTVQDEGLTIADKANSVETRVGSLVFALGRATELSATSGVVSAVSGPWQSGRRRRFERLIASDAPMFPGFSRGPLIDASGRVLGILSSHLGRGQTLAIPASKIDRIVATIGQYGTIRRGHLGVAAQPVALPESLRSQHALTQERGLLLVGLEEEGPAATAGLMIGDILVSVGGVSVTDFDDLRSVLDAGAVGKPVTVHVLRGGEPSDIEVIIGEQPDQA